MSDMLRWRRIERLALLLMLAAALALRVIGLRDAPPGAQHDEVFAANFATQILNGARVVYFDQNGGVMALYAYLVAPVFAFLGSGIVALRLVSVAAGLLSIVVTYVIARKLFGVMAALFSAALLSVTQWHLFESRVGLEPIALLLLAVVSAYAYWRAQESQRLFAYALAGALLGLTLYTYHSSPFVFVGFGAFPLYLFIWRRAEFRAQWRGLAVLLSIALLIGAPLAAHILSTPGDATSRTEDLSADLRAVLDGNFEPLARDVGGVLGMFAFTGDPSFRYNVPGRPVFTLGVGLLAYAGFVLCVKRWREPRYAFVVIWIVCNVIASAVTRSSPSFLRSSAALPFMVMLPSIAVAAMQQWLARRRWPTDRLSFIGPAVILLLAVETGSTVHDYFNVWANLPRVRTAYRADLAEIADFLDAQRPAGTVMLSARFPFDLDQDALYLLQRKPQRYQWFNGRRVLVLPDDRSGQGVSYFVPATNESLSDGAALLQTLDARAGPLDERGKPFFTLYYLPSDELQRLRARTPSTLLRANAGGEVELIGLDMRREERSLHVLLYWRVLQRVRGDVDRNFFVHLLDAQGKRWAQEDRSAYPTSSWRDDDIVWQWYDLKLPPDAPAGSYWLNLGIYDANAAGQPRVNILDGAGQPIADHLRVGPLSFP